MTYAELKKVLDGLSEEQLRDDVTLIDLSIDEVLEVNGHRTIEPHDQFADVLDSGHLVLIFNS